MNYVKNISINKRLLFLGVFIVSMHIIKAQSVLNSGKEKIKLRVDPDFAQGGLISQYFDRIDFIPLETNNMSLFGDIYKMEVSENYFIISDQDTKSILIFKKDGSFYSKIDASKFPNKNTLSNISLYWWNLAFNSKDSLIATSSPLNIGKLSWFNLKGNLVKSTTFKKLTHSIVCLKNGTILYSPFIISNKKDSIQYLVEYLKDTIITQRFLPINTNIFNPQLLTDDISRTYYLYNSGSTILYCNGIKDNTIYEFDEKGLQKEYDLIFPQDYTLPNNYDSLTKVQKHDFLASHNKVIIQIRNVFKVRNYLFLEVVNGGGYISDNRHFMYDLDKGDLVSLDHISSDSTSYYLPFCAQFGTIAATDGKYIYCYVPSVDMFTAKENSKHSTKYSDALNKYFDKASRHSNPVIVRLRLK